MARFFITFLALLAVSVTAFMPVSPLTRSNSGIMMKAATIKTGDTVEVISGSSKGKTGVVEKVMTSTTRAGLTQKMVTVTGVNMKTKHVKPMKEGETGRLDSIAKPVHISNVKKVAAPASE